MTHKCDSCPNMIQSGFTCVRCTEFQAYEYRDGRGASRIESVSVECHVRAERIYVIGALKNERIPEVANALRAEGHAVFADWYSPGPKADEYWQAYERSQGRSYTQAINGAHARAVFDLDRAHLDACTVGVLVMPAGKSAHLEIGYLAGLGKRTMVLFDAEPERYDLMYLFAEAVCFDLPTLIDVIAKPPRKRSTALGFV